MFSLINYDMKSTADISIKKENSYYKMIISDNTPIFDYLNKTDEIDTDGITDKLSNNLLWNNDLQMVNKGTYYIFENGDRIYNIYENESKKSFDKRVKFADDTVLECIIYFDEESGDFVYITEMHDKNGSTHNIKQYDFNEIINSNDKKVILEASELLREFSSLCSFIDMSNVMMNAYAYKKAISNQKVV